MLIRKGSGRGCTTTKPRATQERNERGGTTTAKRRAARKTAGKGNWQ